MRNKDVEKDQEKPLGGAVLCCTSVPPEHRAHMAEVAVQMGAEHRFDLTSDVTHLIIGDSNTPKYRYVAREREDIKTLRLEWVEAVRKVWMKGEDVNIEALEAEYTIAAFAGLKICVTGFEDLAFRAKLQQSITDNGGEYRGDLTKEATHLIAYQAAGKKYQFATQWEVKIVSIRWFQDSLLRGMVLDEALYHPCVPYDQQGIGAWTRHTSLEPQIGKRGRIDDTGSSVPQKLRRTASSKLDCQTESLWGEIVPGAGSHSLRKLDQQTTRDGTPIAKSNILESKSFTINTTGADNGPSVPAEKESRLSLSHQSGKGIFAGLSFWLYAFNPRQTSILREHLQTNDADCVKTAKILGNVVSMEDSTTYVLVPHSFSISELKSIAHVNELVVVTDLWAERCLLSKRYSHPDEHLLSRPLPQLSIPGFAELSINTTGFVDVDLLHISKAIKLLGAKFDQILRPGISLLICNSSTAGVEKIRHASEWGIPSVTVGWLWSCIRGSCLLPYDQYSVEHDRKERLLSRPAAAPKLPAAGKSENATSLEDRTKLSHFDKEVASSDAIARQACNGHRSKSHATPFIQGDGFDEQLVTEDRSRHGDRSTITGDKRRSTFSVTAGNRLPSLPETPQANTYRKHEENVSPDKSRLPGGLTSTTRLTPDDSDHGAPLGLKHKTSTDELSDGNNLDPQSRDVRNRQESSHGEMKELLSKSKSRSRSRSGGSNAAPPNTHIRKRKLLVTALSNLSSSSKEGSTLRPSHASSIDSVNSDGLGSVILNDRSRPTADGKEISNCPKAVAGPTPKEDAAIQPPSLDLSDAALYHEDYREDEEPPQMTQLGYNNPDDAVPLRHMLEKRRRRRMGQPVDEEKPSPLINKKVKDNTGAILGGRDIGRRTRHRDKSP